MNTKTILIFEDEWNTIKGSFELANIYAFEDQLRFKVKAKSQDVSFDDLRNEYSAIFVDITLAKNTQLDGFNIIKKISDENRFDLNKVVVLTGNNKVEEKLNEMQLNTADITIVYKPVDFEELSDVLRKVLS